MSIFQTILVPVDFTINTEVAICKSLEVVNVNDVVVHLLHVTKLSLNDVSLGRSLKTEKEIDAEIKLNDWKLSIEEYLPGSKVICWTQPGLSVEDVIINKSLDLAPDLIVIGKKSAHSLLPVLNTISPSRIAKNTGCPVLTVKPGSLHKDIKHVVVPVTNDASEFKLDILTTLCKTSGTTVSLVTFRNDDDDSDDSSASSMLQAFQKLKAMSNYQVQYAVLRGRNRAKAILQFAEDKQADILLLRSSSETRIGWPGKHISDVIAPDSKLQVLTV